MTDNALPKTKEEALALGVRRFFTGEPCQNGHVAERHIGPNGKGALCVDCRKANVAQGNAKWRTKNPERAKENARVAKQRQREQGTDWASRNPEAAKEYMRKWSDDNREKVREHTRKNIAKYRAADPEKSRNQYRKDQLVARERGTDWRSKNLEKARAKGREWQKAHPAKNRHYAMKYFTTKLNATPRWLTKEQCDQIEAIYEAAVMLSETSGERYDVDHIVPLQGKTVCGLHVPWNLRVITALANQQRAKFWSFEHQDTASMGANT